MGINWDVVGGVGYGLAAGQREQERYRDAQFRQAQYKRMLEQQKVEDAADAAYRAVSPAGTMQVEDRTGMGNIEGPSPKTQTITRTAKDVAADQIRALSQGTRDQRQEAAHMQQLANQQQQFDYQQHKQKVTDAAMRAAMLAETNPVASIQHLAQQYDGFPDGQKLVVQQGRNGWEYGVVGADAKWVQGYEPQPVTSGAAKQLAGQALTFATPEMFHVVNQANAANITAGAHKTGAEAAQQQARTQEAYRQYQTTGEYARAQLDEMKARAERERAQAAAAQRDGTDPLGRMGTPQMFVGPSGTPQMGIPVMTKAGISFQPVAIPQGWNFAKPPPVMNDAQKIAYQTYMKRMEEGGFRNAAEQDKFLDDNNLRPVLGGGSMTDAYIKGKDRPVGGKESGAEGKPQMGIESPRITGASNLTPEELAKLPTPYRGPDAATSLRYKRMLEKYPLSSIREMSPSEADKVYREQGTQMSPEQVAELRKRI